MKATFARTDPWLFFLCLTATILGLFAIFDAGYARSILQSQGLMPREFKVQAVATLVALMAGVLTASIPIRRWQRWSGTIIWITMAAVFATMLPGIGATRSGARRWIDLGPIEIQPSEFAKIGVILFLAGAFACRKNWTKPKIRSGQWDRWLDHVMVPKLVRALPLFAVLLVVLKVEMEPDLGTAAVILSIAFIMMLVGGVSRWSLVVLAVAGLMGAGLLAMKEPYRFERISAHMHRWQEQNRDAIGYQTTQSETAQASSGWMPLGIGTGRAKHMLPAATTDFIMATIGEELGLPGALAVIALMAAIVLRLLYLSRISQDPFAQLVLAGVAGWLAVQSCINLMMANGALPPIGIPLPFFSSGGSSLIALWIAVGICQSAVTQRQLQEESLEGRRHRRRDGRSRLSSA